MIRYAFYITDDSGLIRDALCVFELQRLHVYFQNGSDFHIQLPFKVNIYTVITSHAIQRILIQLFVCLFVCLFV